jgi:3-oxoadipate enol-lactonase / 4-carboxymuconolactone decarboxylase
VRAGGMGAIVDAVLARWFTPEFMQAHPEAVAPLRERFLATDPRGYAVCCGAIGEMDLRGSNVAIAAPTLILAGVDDPATPVGMMEEIRARVPGAELVVIPRAAHILAVERADAVNRHLGSFLDALGPAPQARGGSVSFEQGLANRKSVPGVEHVQRSLEGAGEFAGPWPEFITRVAWGETWGDPTLPHKTRSMPCLPRCRAAPGGGVQAPRPPGAVQRRDRRGAPGPVDPGRRLRRRARRQCRLPLGEGGTRSGSEMRTAGRSDAGN